MITDADEAAIAMLPADAWKPGIAQDGSLEEDKRVADVPTSPAPAWTASPAATTRSTST